MSGRGHNCYGMLEDMNDVQERLGGLQAKGWTLAAVADECGVTPNAVEKWKAGDAYPRNVRGVLLVLGALLQRKRIPKQRRYAKGTRKRNVGDS